MAFNTVANRPEAHTIEDARLVFKNFEGKEGKYNPPGDRSFCVILSPEDEFKLINEGWNVKHFRPTEPGVPPQAYLPVAVSYKHRPPRIVLITSRNRTLLEEEDCKVIDWVDIKTVDVTVNPSSWAVSGNSGIKAYLKTMYVIVQEDYLDLKYADYNELPARDGRVDENLALSDRPHYDYDGEVVG